MSRNGILVSVDQFLQPVPATLGAVKVDHLEPIRPRVNERLPTHRVERDALDIAAAPLVNDRHAASFDLVRIETRLIVLRAMGQRECQDVRMADQAETASVGGPRHFECSFKYGLGGLLRYYHREAA